MLKHSNLYVLLLSFSFQFSFITIANSASEYCNETLKGLAVNLKIVGPTGSLDPQRGERDLVAQLERGLLAGQVAGVSRVQETVAEEDEVPGVNALPADLEQLAFLDQVSAWPD
jgi:hypothetical protein